jgi:hypothetical protein
MSVASIVKNFSFDDLVVLLVSEGIGIPLTIAAGDTFVHEQWKPTIIGFGVGLPLMGLGATFPFWKSHVAAWFSDAVVKIATFGFPVVLLTAIVYVLGPYILTRISPRADDIARAVISKLPAAPTADQVAEIAARKLLHQAPTPESPDELSKLTKPFQEQIDQKTSELESASQQLSSAREQVNALSHQNAELTKQLQRINNPETLQFADPPFLTRKLTHNEAETLIGLIDELSEILHEGTSTQSRYILPDSRYTPPPTLEQRIQLASQGKEKLSLINQNLSGKFSQSHLYAAELAEVLMSPPQNQLDLNNTPLNRAVQALDSYLQVTNRLLQRQPRPDEEVVTLNLERPQTNLSMSLDKAAAWAGIIERDRLPRLRKEAESL